MQEGARTAIPFGSAFSFPSPFIASPAGVGYIQEIFDDM